VKWTLEAVNARLKAGKIGVTVRQRGDRLSLRATLPPKPGSSKLIWYQQDISLRVYANSAGLHHAEVEAKLLGTRIAGGEFDWHLYLDSEPAQPMSEAAAWVRRFEEDYFARRGRTPTTESTWKSDYVPAWRLLGSELSPETLRSAAASVPANTRKRKLVCEKLAALAKFAGVSVDLGPYVGNYGISEASMRYIPLKHEIEESRSLFDGRPDWQWAYGILAAYGLRPHEVFFCEVSPEPPHLLKVLQGKTGYREVYPYCPQWAVEWQLHEVRKPPCTAKTLKDYGNRVTKAFSRSGSPFTAYCLRHAYAIRLCTEYAVPVRIAAEWTGHDAAVYLRIYTRWISGGEKRRVFEETVRRAAEFPQQ